MSNLYRFHFDLSGFNFPDWDHLKGSIFKDDATFTHVVFEIAKDTKRNIGKAFAHLKSHLILSHPESKDTSAKTLKEVATLSLHRNPLRLMDIITISVKAISMARPPS